MPFFSVVIPTYNREKIIFSAIDSVINQSFRDFEILIIDNGSTDNTKNFILESYDDPRVKYIYQNGSGTPASPRNKGIAESNGKWVCFLDSDDKWSLNKLEVIFNAIKNNLNIDIICHNERTWDPLDQSVKKLIKYGPDSEYLYKEMLLSGNRLSTSATCIRKEFLANRELNFHTSRSFCMVEDYNLWLMMANSGAKFLFINEVLGFYRLGNQNLISDKKLFCKNLGNLLKFHTENVQNFQYDKKKLWKKLKIRSQICNIRYSNKSWFIRLFKFLTLFIKNPISFLYTLSIYLKRIINGSFF